MKAQIISYHGQRFEERFGFKPNAEIPAEQVFEIAQTIFKSGLNVMLLNTQFKVEAEAIPASIHVQLPTSDKSVKHEADYEPGIILFIDDKNFKQR